MTPTGRNLIHSSQLPQHDKWVAAIHNFKEQAKAAQQNLGLMREGAILGYEPNAHIFASKLTGGESPVMRVSHTYPVRLIGAIKPTEL